MAEDKKEDLGFMEDSAGAGYENISSQDVSTPFLKILQALSPEVEAGNEAQIKGAEPGMFCNSLTGRLYGREVNLIPLHYTKEWLEWKPDRGGLVGRHEPFSINVDQTDFSKWKYGDNVIAETLMFFCLVEGHLDDGPIVYPLSSTGIKHGKNWNTQIMMTKLPSGNRAPFYSSVWTLTSKKYIKPKGSYYQIGDRKTNLDRKRFVLPDEFNNYILPMRETLADLQKGLDFKSIEGGSEQQMIEAGEGSIDESKVDY